MFLNIFSSFFYYYNGYYLYYFHYHHYYESWGAFNNSLDSFLMKVPTYLYTIDASVEDSNIMPTYLPGLMIFSFTN